MQVISMRRSYALRAFLIVFGILLFYVMQMAPSPVLHLIRESYSLQHSDLLLNLSISIIFPPIVIGSLTGTSLERRCGTKGLYTLSLILCAAGAAVTLLCGSSYVLFLAGRAVFGLGFGFGIPFIGSAIMRYFRPEHRELMDTVNAMFPFIGTAASFLLALPLSALGSLSFHTSVGIWCIPILLVLALWLPAELPDSEISSGGSAIYGNLLRRKEILLLCVIFICDFCCYSYMGVVLPTLLQEGCGLSDSVANTCAAAAFPVMGLIGSAAGGLWCKRSGLRKPSLVTGQILKFLGIALMVLPAPDSTVAVIAGAGLFGFANGLWMPAMYCMPMELPGMTPELVGAAFGFISSCGLAFGFIAPTVGGALTDVITRGAAAGASAHVYGLRWTLFAFAFLNLIGFACALALRECGPGRKAGR